jgi:HAE1 family hydrophobic/amphiphilic exporter-1
MMGLMLAVGMLVDNAVVVTESIHRHQLVDQSPSRSILKGVNEVGLAITAGTITTVIVFLPTVLNTKDEIGIYLKHVAVSMSIAMGASLVLAATVVPLLVSRVKPPRRDRKRTLVDRLGSAYRAALAWSLSHRAATVGVSLALLVSIAVPLQFVKKSMFDQAEDRRLRLHYHVNGSYTLEKVEQAVDAYEDYLFANQDEFEIGSIYTFYNSGYAMSTVLLKKGKEAKRSVDDIREAIRKDLPRLAITEPSFEWRSASGQDQSVRVQLVGKSSEELAALSREVAWGLSQVKGLADVRSEAEIGTEEVHVVVDRLRARQSGFSSQDVASVVAAAMRGINLRPFQGDGTEIPVRVEMQEKDRQTLEDLENLPLFAAGAEPVKLASLAAFSMRRGPQTIHRENRTTSIGVTANLNNITMEEARQKIGAALKNFNFPPGYTWNYGQTFDHEEQTFKTMIVNILLALALIYFVMAALFESLLFPAAIWTQVIYAVVGVYWFFMITGTKMNMMAMIGILILIGVVVNNGIVLIDYVNQLRARGMSRRDALVEGGQARMRPILMTAGTTVLSLVPLCMTATEIGGAGGPAYFPMARAIVGGLVFSTVITLLILPTTYSVLDDWRGWASRTLRAARQNRGTQY